MKAAVDSSGNLVVTNVETFLGLLFVGCTGAAVGVWFAPVPTRAAAGWTALLALFSLALLSSFERSSFVFDGARGILNWRKVTPFSRRAGEVPFQSITGLSLEQDRDASHRGSRRLVIHTTKGPLSVTTAFTGVGTAAEQVGETVRSYLASSTPRQELQFIRG